MPIETLKGKTIQGKRISHDDAKKSHLGGAPETNPYFFLPKEDADLVIHRTPMYLKHVTKIVKKNSDMDREINSILPNFCKLQ